ncbi:hypothetical protein A3J78_02510 [Candidatus Beckwithbacteria bacterium RBG_13_35_6]|uniref:Phosphoribosyltransferase domain-containing protein n=1 Tax=Candidatus Beckwithbacteria bacterium RBG_13_35_6 TaxID=1797456 RepID=A0A1F5DG66_9BACT|nr:MAG: hypothetical protein A3J78_02510 [Candidatus Beckwithbacteria bacterium RBG_13_35_6]
MDQLAFRLAKKIISKQLKFDRLVVLAKGGWTWGRTISDYLQIKNVASIQIQFYANISETQEKSTIIQSLPLSINKENILLFDDISDSGETLITANSYLTMCGAQKITTATLFFKPWTKTKPDFYSAETKAWVIFPHEIRESVESINNRWRKNGLSKAKIIKRFAAIGLPKDQVKYFLNSL